MAKARGQGRVYQPNDPKTPGRKLQTWWIDYSVGGTRYRESSKSQRKADAVTLLKRRLGEHAIGRFAGPEVQRLTFEDLETGLLDAYQLAGRRSIGRARIAFNNLRECFGGMKATAITARALAAYAAERREEAKPATVQYELAVLRRAMTVAVQQGRMPSRPPFPHIPVQNARTGWFTKEEMERIVSEIAPPLKNLVIAAYYTGWRKSELLGLRWSEVDGQAGVLRLAPGTTKTGSGRVLPYTVLPPLARALSAQRAYTDEVARRQGCIVQLVFHREGERIIQFRAAWLSACQRAGVKLGPGYRCFHSFRASAARNLTAAGVPEHHAMALMGHKTSGIFRRYSITSEGDLHTAMARLAAWQPDQEVRALRAEEVSG
jgi:integrase